MDGRMMNELDKVKDDQLSEEFLKQTTEFCQYIEKEAPLKCLQNGQALKNGQSMYFCVGYYNWIL